MSHTIRMKLEMTDKAVLMAVAKKLGISCQQGEHRLFGGIEKGLGIKLPGWNYPVVIKENGEAAYDNYGGSWGNIEELHKLEAHYGAEKARQEALILGYEVIEGYNRETDEIVLTINTGMGA